jgi:glycosyltransferase involved in cell wall biosynthesis
MNTQPLVSIIIPTYNRAHLIGETLDSVVAQTYTNWECIIVDDGSSDNTDEVVGKYVEKDSRFKYYHRPETRTKGANTCRNIGLHKAEGDYIVFFDSDDLMTQDHIQVKLEPLLDSDYDYSIAKTKYFNVEDTNLERYYKFDEFKLTAFNYIVQNINWLTCDICIKSKLAKSISFNEKMKSGQEYNYFSKLVLKSINAKFVNKITTLYRYHSDSIQTNLKKKGLKPLRSFLSSWLTYQDIKKTAPPLIRKALLYKCMRTLWREKKFVSRGKISFFLAVIREFKGYTFHFVMMVFFRFYLNKGYSFRERLKIKAGMN